MKVIVDGHNLIGKLADISLADPNDEAQLVILLRQYAARTGRKLTVVFDGGLPGGPSRKLSGGGVRVVFASSGRQADPLIINRIRRIRDLEAWLVVSSDRAILRAAARYKVRAQRSEDFAAELEEAPRPPPAAPDPRLIPPSKDEVDAWLREFTGR